MDILLRKLIFLLNVFRKFCLVGFTLLIDWLIFACRCHYSCNTCDGPSHTNCKSCFKNATLSDGMCHFCIEGHFMNQENVKCELCHSSCSTCTGPLANDCLTCKKGLFMDNSHCVSCCSNENMQSEFNECCQCVSLSGPCASIDKTRSVELISEQPIQKAPLGYFLHNIVTHFFTYVVLIAIIFTVTFFILNKRVKNRHLRVTNIDYHKLNLISPHKRNIHHRLLDDLDEDSEGEDELTLYAKS